jgi:valyl-tRNA synthetase
MNLPKVYEASNYEAAIYELWMRSGAFQPSGHGEPFSIVLPPPNATGRLHIGHAAMLAIEDAVVRYQRMRGKDVLWVPGTDHAAIATNAIMERQLADEGMTKHDIGREAFLNRLADFVENSQDNIRTQIKAMGASLDWSRERYTMEPAMNRLVSEVFIKMSEDELIYRGHRIVNWDNVLHTTVSDDELEYKEEVASFYTFKYGPFEIGTARPETKFGDKYVVMHPDDKRYTQYKHGQTIEVEWINGPITATIIKDESVDPEFGTGVMTITPWHSMIDFEIAERHNLDKQQIIDLDGKLLPVAGEFAGQHIAEARPKIVEKMRDKGLLISEATDYVHNVAYSDRGKAVIEPQIMEQWFVDVNKPAIKWKGKQRSLKEVMQSVVRDGDITILPKRFEKVYFAWIDNLRDWCISRQIWWGHRIPAWYRPLESGGHEVEVGYDQPDGGNWHQDPDTLDTWFSSALWSWSTLIEPEIALNEEYSLHDMLKHSKTYQRYHPTTLMETGYDIIFFWVARMILMTTYITGEIPFKTVYLHGLVRTKDGSKMTKSRPESIIDPLDVIPKYGTDAVRLSLLVGQAPGNDMRMYEDKIASYRNFCNKLWNVARFIEGMVGDEYDGSGPKPESPADHWILERLQITLKDSEQYMETYEIGKAYEVIYHFIWDDLADWYVEAAKASPNKSVLIHVLESSLKAAHPFAPFVTETIWDTLKWEKSLLITSQWPKAHSFDSKKSAEFEKLKTIVSEIRAIQSLLGLSNNTLYYSDSSAFLDDNQVLIKMLARLRGVARVESGKGLHLTKTDIVCWLDIEQQKINNYIGKMDLKQQEQEAIIATLQQRLENKAYIHNAPKHLVDETKAQLKEAQALLERVSQESRSIKQSAGIE